LIKEKSNNVFIFYKLLQDTHGFKEQEKQRRDSSKRMSFEERFGYIINGKPRE